MIIAAKSDLMHMQTVGYDEIEVKIFLEVELIIFF